MIRPSAVVVVAASTGGLGPLRKIAAALPYDLPATVLVVTHAARTGPSRLPLILSTDGPLPAMHAVDRQALEAGRILVGPPDRHLMIERDKVRVRLEPAAIPLRPCADILFESAARAFGPRTVGVVLSGKGTDGAAGLATIRAVGGRTIVQAPADAQAPSMPGAALEATDPDACVAAPQIALAIERLVRALPAAAGSRRARKRRRRGRASLRGSLVLVVEDRFLLGSEIVRMLGELGCSAAGPAPTVAAGLRLLKAAGGDLDLAVLDVDLRRESVFPLARALRARRIPIAFVTGYAAEALPREWLSSARVEKPFGARELAAALRAARSRRRRPRPARPSGIPALDPAAEALKEGRNLMMVVRAWLREHDQNSGALDVRGRGRRRRLRNMQRNQQSGPQADPPKVADRLSRVLSDDELVDQASQESFPASDAPSWTSGTDRNVETRVPRRDGQRPPPTSMNDPVV